jgi:hypothetical protein
MYFGFIIVLFGFSILCILNDFFNCYDNYLNSSFKTLYNIIRDNKNYVPAVSLNQPIFVRRLKRKTVNLKHAKNIISKSFSLS